MSCPDDFPVLMSAPNDDAPRLASVALGENTLTLELHYSTGEIGVLPLGFKDEPSLYTLVETGYTCDAAPFGEMFCFVAEHVSGKRYRWYVYADSPVEVFVQINAYIAAKVRPKIDAAVIPYIVQQAA